MLRIAEEDVLNTLNEGGPNKDLKQVCKSLARSKRVPVAQINCRVVRRRLNKLSQNPKLVEVWNVDGTNEQSWCIHYLE